MIYRTKMGGLWVLSAAAVLSLSMALAARASGVPTANSANCGAAFDPDPILKSDSVTDTLAAIFGQDVSALEKHIEDAVVRLDHALEQKDTNKASRILVEIDPFASGLPKKVITLRRLWFFTEFAQLRMAVAERRIALIDQLKSKHPQSAEALNKLSKAEEAEWDAQAKTYGNFFKSYYRLRKHLNALMDQPQSTNPNTPNMILTMAAAPAPALPSFKVATDWLMRDIGVKDPLFTGNVEFVDKAFEDAIVHAGLPASEAQAGKMQLELDAALKPNAVTPSPDMIQLQEMLARSLESEIQLAMSKKERNTQIVASITGLVTQPIATKILMNVLVKYVPMGAKIRDTQLVSTLTQRFHDSELTERFSYELTRLKRDQSLTTYEKLNELRNMIARGQESGLSPFELLARRADLNELWDQVYALANDPANAQKFIDLKPVMDEWQAKKASGKLDYLSPTYRISPLESTIRLLAMIVAAYQVEQHAGDVPAALVKIEQLVTGSK